MKFIQKNIIYIFLLGVLAALAFVPGVKKLFFPVAEVESHLHIPEEDYDVQLKGINTTSTNLKNFRGKKVLFLNFWGPCCKPCRDEWPSIQQLYDKKKDDMNFVLNAMMDEDEKVRKFIKENNYTAPVYLAETPINNSILPKVFPTTFILDQHGRILEKETSSKDWFSSGSRLFIDNITKQ